jgi:hypothetical protein
MADAVTPYADALMLGQQRRIAMKNTSKTPTKKLTLNKQTLRQLDNRALGQADGGVINQTRISCECATSEGGPCDSFDTTVCP